MAAMPERYEFVSVAEAAVRLAMSPTTIRKLIRSGELEAERVARPQGSAYLVKVPIDAPDTNADERTDTSTLAEIIAGYRHDLSEKDQVIARLSEAIADLREERGTLATHAEYEHARADTLAEELERTRRPWWRRLLSVE